MSAGPLAAVLAGCHAQLGGLQGVRKLAICRLQVWLLLIKISRDIVNRKKNKAEIKGDGGVEVCGYQDFAGQKCTLCTVACRYPVVCPMYDSVCMYLALC